MLTRRRRASAMPGRGLLAPGRAIGQRTRRQRGAIHPAAPPGRGRLKAAGAQGFSRVPASGAPRAHSGELGAILPIHVHAPCRYHPPRVISRTQRHAGGASKTGASEQSKSVARHSSSRAECPAVRSTQQSPARRKAARAPRPRSTYVQPSWRAGRSWLERALRSARSVDVSKGEEL